jgi:integrase
VPLSALAVELIESMRPLSGDTLLFPSRNDPDQPMPHQSISQALRRFCAASGFPKLTPRDLRRTVKSRMGEIGISKDIRDRLQNHALHDVSSKHYDRYDYLAEKRTAINKWTVWFEETLGLREADSNILAFEAKQ